MANLKQFKWPPFFTDFSVKLFRAFSGRAVDDVPSKVSQTSDVSASIYKQFTAGSSRRLGRSSQKGSLQFSVWTVLKATFEQASLQDLLAKKHTLLRIPPIFLNGH